MFRRVSHIVLVAFLIGVISMAGMTLLAKPEKGGFKPCPYPPCMAPCALGAEPDVLCKTPDGSVVRTTFACCCCGGGGGGYYKWLHK
jgi:hypothetical protein